FSYEVLEHSLGYTGSGADIPYTVASDGTVSFPGGGSVEGIVSSDGNLFVGVDTDPTTENEIVLAVGIKR
ncbi:MAG TPA: hypothetical protein DCO77_00590, partial [Nitrospiraceae bacterium]|nr:hypothetical protein [Nitrospiraceae bacterium]